MPWLHEPACAMHASIPTTHSQVHNTLASTSSLLTREALQFSSHAKNLLVFPSGEAVDFERRSYSSQCPPFVVFSYFLVSQCLLLSS